VCFAKTDPVAAAVLRSLIRVHDDGKATWTPDRLP
jgi:hypothetical protein